MRLLTVVAMCSAAVLVSTVPAQAAKEVPGTARDKMIRGVAKSAPGKADSLKITKRGKVTFDATFRNIVTADNILAVRSSIAPKWGLLAIAAVGNQGYQRTYLVKRTRGSWRAVFSATRGSENIQICKFAKPATPVALDLGFSDLGLSGERCKHKRSRFTLVRQMTSAELSSVRTMVEWRWDTGGLQPGPVQPRVTDRWISNSNCKWDGLGSAVTEARGEVSKINPRWGAVDVGCMGSACYDATQYLVRRSGRTGAFTRVPAHVLASWSSRSDLCTRNRNWAVPAAVRVSLEFCSPFPSEIRSVFR